jgi:glutamyl-tRNA reductase
MAAEIEEMPVAAVQAEVERTRREELETALTQLEAAGAVTDAQRAIVKQSAERLTQQLVGAPLDRAASTTEAAALGRLFLNGGDGDE